MVFSLLLDKKSTLYTEHMDSTVSSLKRRKKGPLRARSVRVPLFVKPDNEKAMTKHLRFIDDSLLCMVSFVRQKPAMGWSTVLK
jgi:hypothetical protein